MAGFPQDPREDNQPGRKLHWHVLGGNNKHRIGANCGLCVYEETDAAGENHRKAILFDIGLLSGDPKYPEDPALAESDTIIPDLTRFLRKKDDPAHAPEIQLDSIYLTHNHADHLGAIPFLVLMGYELPKIHATPYTARRLEQELANAGLDPAEWPEIYMIAPGKPIQEGPVTVTAFWVSHSTPQSVGFFIETPEGNILNPGDFKLDQSVVWGPSFSEEQFNRIVSKPVDLLLLDSTGADRDIPSVTEEDMRETLRDLMELHPGKRFVVAVMGGFEENLASVAQVTAEYGRTLWVAGWSHEQALSALAETGMTLSDSIGAEVDLRILGPGRSARDLGNAAPGDSVIVVTGAQGKPGAVLTRAAEGRHNALVLDPATDIVLFCAPSIPGQEGGRARLLSLLRGQGFEVLTRQEAPHLYPHAHARLPEIIEFAKMANPRTVLPVHGDENLRAHCADAMQKLGKRVLPADNGDVIRVTRDGCRSTAPATKGRPKLLGFKTLQGANWLDRHYLMVTAPQERLPEQRPPANSNSRKAKRPKIFNIDPK